MTSYLFDTYAIIEMLEGNRSYTPFLDASWAINDFILAELSYHFLKSYGNKTAEKYTNEYAGHSVKVPVKVIFDAMVYRYKNKKKKLSMTDCVSYCQALEMGMRFLTGDKQFENAQNVEYVK